MTEMRLWEAGGFTEAGFAYRLRLGSETGGGAREWQEFYGKGCIN